jgi:hypothetical protein
LRSYRTIVQLISKARRIAKSLAILEESPALGSFCQNLDLDCKSNIVQSKVESDTAAPDLAPVRRTPGMSNCYCHPGRAGGTPITLRRRRCRRPIAMHSPLRPFRRAKLIGDPVSNFQELQAKTGVVLRPLAVPRLPARRAFNTARSILVIFRTGGGSGITLISGGIRHNDWGSNNDSARP